MEARFFPVSSGFATRAAFRMELWLWARLLPFRLPHELSLDAIFALAEPTAGQGRFTGMPAAAIVRAVRRTLRRPVLMRDRRCLREGLLAYRFLAGAGHRPKLHFGVDPDIVASARAKAHCWVTLDGVTVIGETQTRFVEILSVPRGDIGDGPQT
jgi:hypothetical protein